ncbi:Rad17 cell cycle checkpoint protein-domain-containing protein [Mycena pura]|uniref:Rad17 cell cycle checkpoint protein-domain-containing protein n=1 Tax=Mycena pura TaxID=153505 RepID=A0AAD6VGJ4_9AGAR|nr:Rad17 cell cycle checkpoint protein-domain-containing protein [Mycena pura]
MSKASQPSTSKAKSTKKTKSKVTTVKLGATPSHSQRINPLTAFVNTSCSEDGTRNTSQLTNKGKEKQIYSAELAVHAKKVLDVRRWLDEALVGGPSGKLRKYRRILALTGPAGTGKTATIRVLARELDCEVLEWRNAMVDTSPTIFRDDALPETTYPHPYDSESLFSKFEAFLARASMCRTIFDDASESSSPQSQSSRRRIILLEDLPNILHANTRTRFHVALQSLVMSSALNPVPVVIVVSDAGMRGEASDERLANGSYGKDRDDVLDIRTILPKDILNGPYVTQIGFNPIAPTLMKKALQTLISTHFASSKCNGFAPTKETLDIVIQTSNGDIRSAIMALQFACVVGMPGVKGRKKGSSNAAVVLQAVTRREQSLELFHLIGKVMYNKRKGDPPNPSATARDMQKERDLDALLKDPQKLPSFLDSHARRTSRVNVDLLYADSPVDSSLFSLYIHQNYTQFCNEVEECDGVADWLSWIDSSGGEAWYQANPHRFHLLTLGTLHSLPSPVPRRGQKLFKPEFFDFLAKEKDAWDAVRDVRGWLMEDAAAQEGDGWRLGGWCRAEVVTELGGVLKARDAKASRPHAPASHRLFSSLQFVFGGDDARLSQLDEGDAFSANVDVLEDEGVAEGGWSDIREGGGWLENDDIEDFY